MVLYETHRGSHRVAACSARAAALGMAEGMPLAEAKMLARGEALHLEAYDPAADREALEKLAEACRRHSPVVALDDSPAPDGLILDVTGLAHLFGGETVLAAGILDDFTRRRLAVRIAVADTVAAAWATAHFGKGKERGERRGERAAIKSRPVVAEKCTEDRPQDRAQLGPKS